MIRVVVSGAAGRMGKAGNHGDRRRPGDRGLRGAGGAGPPRPGRDAGVFAGLPENKIIVTDEIPRPSKTPKSS